MPISGISGVGAAGFTPMTPVTLAGDAGRTGGTQGPSGPDNAGFGNLLVEGLDRLEGVQDKADQLAVRAATGDLSDIHDYTIAATESSVATQLTVAVRNKAIESFNEIMRMQV